MFKPNITQGEWTWEGNAEDHPYDDLTLKCGDETICDFGNCLSQYSEPGIVPELGDRQAISAIPELLKVYKLARALVFDCLVKDDRDHGTEMLVKLMDEIKILEEKHTI